MFLEAIMKDYSSIPPFLDTILEGSNLPALRQIIIEIKSIKFPYIFFH